MPGVALFITYYWRLHLVFIHMWWFNDRLWLWYHCIVYHFRMCRDILVRTTPFTSCRFNIFSTVSADSRLINLSSPELATHLYFSEWLIIHTYRYSIFYIFLVNHYVSLTVSYKIFKCIIFAFLTQFSSLVFPTYLNRYSVFNFFTFLKK